LNGATNEFARAGVRRMALYHDRAAGRECGRGIATGHRKGEWKIAGAENRHWPERDVAQTEIRARQRLAVGHRQVNAEVEPFPLAYYVSEKPQLPDSPCTLPFNTSRRKTRFSACTIYQRVANLKYLIGDAFQELGSFLYAGRAVNMECLPSELTGEVDFFAVGEAKRRLKRFSRSRVYRPEVTLLAGYGTRAY
jgi:hypothetical protein